MLHTHRNLYIVAYVYIYEMDNANQIGLNELVVTTEDKIFIIHHVP